MHIITCAFHTLPFLKEDFTPFMLDYSFCKSYNGSQCSFKRFWSHYLLITHIYIYINIYIFIYIYIKYILSACHPYDYLFLPWFRMMVSHNLLKMDSCIKYVACKVRNRTYISQTHITQSPFNSNAA